MRRVVSRLETIFIMARLAHSRVGDMRSMAGRWLGPSDFTNSSKGVGGMRSMAGLRLGPSDLQLVLKESAARRLGRSQFEMTHVFVCARSLT